MLTMTSTTTIRIIGTAYEFRDVDELINSQSRWGRHWWRQYVVALPDIDSSSSAFVEILGETISLGRPSHERSIVCDSYRQALRWGEVLNKSWLKAHSESPSLDWRKFVDDASERPPAPPRLK